MASKGEIRARTEVLAQSLLTAGLDMVEPSFLADPGADVETEAHRLLRLTFCKLQTELESMGLL